MKIESIQIQNVLGARNIDVATTKPINLFAGFNGAGKSSIQEAVRMALTGESVRVSLKKEYGQLVSEGEKSGEILIATEEHGSFSMCLPSGKGVAPYDIPALPYILDAQRFASLTHNDRRTFLFGLLGLSADGQSVVDQLTSKGAQTDKIEAIRPLLRVGFETAHDEAKGKTREAKGAWRAVTGETYGSNKAETWASNMPSVDDARITELEAELVTTQADGETAVSKLAELKTRAQMAAESEAKRAALAEQSGLIKRITDKLAVDEAGLAEWTEKTEKARAAATGEERVGLVHDLAYAVDGYAEMLKPFGEMSERERDVLRNGNDALVAYEKQYGEIKNAGEYDPEAKSKLAECERSLGVYQKSVANGKRDLAQAEAAAEALKTLGEATQAPTESEITAVQAHIAELREHKKAIETTLNSLRNDKRIAAEAADKTIKAANHHLVVQQWELIADALAPDGIPSKLLADAINPINDRLKDSAEIAEWLPVAIADDMGITYGGRAYALLSESEQWRVDAMIAEAISHMSGVRLMVLDRFDVLDLKGRSDVIYWMDALANDDEIDTALIFGTLKAAPTGLPESFGVHWVQDGVCLTNMGVIE